MIHREYFDEARKRKRISEEISSIGERGSSGGLAQGSQRVYHSKGCRIMNSF